MLQRKPTDLSYLAVDRNECHVLYCGNTVVEIRGSFEKTRELDSTSERTSCKIGTDKHVLWTRIVHILEQISSTLKDRGIEDRSLVRKEIRSSTASRQALTPTWAPCLLSLRVKCPVHKLHIWPPYNVEIKNERKSTSAPTLPLITWSLAM